LDKRILPSMLLAFMLTLTTAPIFVMDSLAWSNGGYSADPSHPDYGTHDWIAQHALDWLPTIEKQYILDNLAAYLYGTELPDNWQAPDGIGDSTKHHIYYNSAEVMTDDDAAVRASTEYSNTLNFLKTKNYAIAAKNAGIMSHYIVDMAVFGHVMGSGTDWGTEVHHTEDYEPYVNARTSNYSAEFNSYLSFDGSLTAISAYDAAKNLAYDTTFDVDGDLTCVWMDQNYDWNNPTFKNRAGESLNLAVNYLTDVLHTLHQNWDTTPPITTINLSGILGDNDWFTSDIAMFLSATDDTEVDKIKYSFDDATWTTYTTPVTITNEGNTIVYYKSTDKAGNPEAPKTKTVKIDKTIPSGTLTINNDAAYVNSTSVTLNLTAADATSGVYRVRFSNDGVWDTETWETSPSTKTWTLPSGDGTKTVYYQIKDNAGLISTHSDTIILDTSPPTGSITIAGDATYTNSLSVTLILSVEDATSGVAQMCFSHDNTTWTPFEAYSTSKAWSITSGNGTKTVYAQFKDNAGLSSQSYFDTIILDTTTPTILITSPSPDYEIRSSTVSVTWIGSDETSGVSHYEIRLDGGLLTNIGTNTNHTFTGLGDGSHTVELKAVDNAGNTKQDTVNFIVNTSPLFGPGYMEEAAITTIIVAALGIALYFLKTRKH